MTITDSPTLDLLRQEAEVRHCILTLQQITEEFRAGLVSMEEANHKLEHLKLIISGAIVRQHMLERKYGWGDDFEE